MSNNHLGAVKEAPQTQVSSPVLHSQISSAHAVECINFISATSGKLSGMTMFEAENFIKAIEMLKLFISQKQDAPKLA